MHTEPRQTQPASREKDSRMEGIVFVGVMVALMWASEIVDVVAGHRLDQYGIRPRDTDGLVGIATSPFLHGGFDHLISNTVPFVVLGVTIALSGLARVAIVSAVVAFVGGLGTWLVAPGNSVHIGASGLVFGFAAYLIGRALFSRNLLHLAIGVVVVVIWGTALLGGLLPEPGISWQGHLFGGIGGLVAARLLHRRAQRAETPPHRPLPKRAGAGI